MLIVWESFESNKLVTLISAIINIKIHCPCRGDRDLS